MQSLSEIKTILSSNRQMLVAKYGLKNIAIFGSYSRGENTEQSDIDIMVDFSRPIGIAFVDLADELEKILHAKVDLVSRNAIKPNYFRHIKAELNYV